MMNLIAIIYVQTNLNYKYTNLMKILEVCQFSGYGHYKIGILFRNKLYTYTTTDMQSIDDYHSDVFEKDGREFRHLRGYRNLRNQIVRANNLK